MSNATIKCPECHSDITLSETLAAEHIEAERKRHRAAMAELKTSFEKKYQQNAANLQERENAVEQAERSLDQTLSAERKSLTEKIEQNVRQEMHQAIVNAEKQLNEKDESLKLAQANELESRKRIAEADQKLQQADLEVQKKIDLERQSLQAAQQEREKAMQDALAKRESAVVANEQQLAKTLQSERAKLLEQVRTEVQNDMNVQLTDTEQRLALKSEQLEKAQAIELESLKRVSEAEEKIRQSELEVQRRLDKERAVIREQTQKESADEAQRTISEKDLIITKMNQQIEILHRKADSKSQQLQGDLEESNVFNRIRDRFPADEITRVPRGKNGADIIFKVRSPSGKIAGTILLEVKDTQTFSRGWPTKLKTDVHELKADIGVIVTRVLPSNVKSFGQIDDVWVTQLDYLLPLLSAFRDQILHVSQVRNTAALSDNARDIVYNYLTSNDFSRRVTTMVDSYQLMRDSLDKQKRQFSLRMSEQESALDKLITGLSGVYGDLSQRAGTALKPITGLELDDELDDELSHSQTLLPLKTNDAVVKTNTN